MDLSKLPIWSAYLIAPAFVLVCTAKVIIKSESPFLIGILAIGLGLVCAAALHAYSWAKRKVRKE